MTTDHLRGSGAAQLKGWPRIRPGATVAERSSSPMSICEYGGRLSACLIAWNEPWHAADGMSLTPRFTAACSTRGRTVAIGIWLSTAA
jgi:hypothetical protein